MRQRLCRQPARCTMLCLSPYQMHDGSGWRAVRIRRYRSNSWFYAFEKLRLRMQTRVERRSLRGSVRSSVSPMHEGMRSEHGGIRKPSELRLQMYRWFSAQRGWYCVRNNSCTMHDARKRQTMQLSGYYGCRRLLNGRWFH